MKNMSRREMMAKSAGVAGFTFLPASVLGLGGAVPPSEKLNIAFVGIGRRGSYNLRELDNLGHNVSVLCDVDWQHYEGQQHPMAFQIVEQYPKARRYDDWRVMLEKEDKNIDAVVVATANHTHASIAIAAMKMRKHVYVEKPLAHSVEEVRAMQAAAKKYGVTTQTGCQGHSSEDCRLIVERVRAGIIGTVKEVHIFQNVTAGGRMYDYEKEPKIVTEKHVPPDLKWDLWLGPAPYRGFNTEYIPGAWRSWFDFGDGVIGDYCCHSFDPVFWSLGLGLPTKIETRTEPSYNYDAVDRQIFPNSSDVRWDFPARGKTSELAMVWHYGRNAGDIPLPMGWDPKEILPPAGGGIIFGSQGAIVFGPIYASLPLTASSGNYKPVTWGTPYPVKIFPKELEAEYSKVEKTLPRPFNHWADFAESAKANKQAGAPFSYGGPMTETALLGNIGISQPGKIMYYDPEKMCFENNPEADKKLRVSYREGWELPKV
jgi:predicted dehydrogenase